MSRQAQRALIASLMMILASLAGCIGTDELDDGDASTDSLGTVMVSTYHIEQLVSAVGGDLVDIEMMSTSNIPVHDYEPSAQDLIRLQSADLFFYHGLGLEPWVESTLDTMGSDAPLATSTHALPTGEVELDYESMMIAELCGFLSEPSTTDVHILAEHAEDAGELHGDEGAYNMAFPDDHDEEGEHHDEEDEHHDEEGEHHDEEGEHHDEHDHGEEGLLRAEETIEDAEGCPAGTVISVYHFEEGSYMLEFEAEDMETFTMAMAAMAGAHDHAHDHDDHEDGEHEDGHHHEDGFCYDEVEDTEWSGWDSETMNESDCLGPGLVWIVDDGHGDEDHDEHGVCHDIDNHENHDEYEDQESCEAAGHLWMEEGHDDHEGACHDEDTHETHDEYEDEASCEAAGYHWMEGDHGDHDDDITPEEALSEFDTDGDGNLSWDEFWVAWNTDDDHDDHHDEEHSPLDEVMEDYMMELLMPMFNESDADTSGGLSLEELEHFIEDIEAMEDDGTDMPTGDYIVAAFDEDGDSMLSYEEFSEMMGMGHDEDHDENETHEGNETHDENTSSEEEFMEAMMEMMFEMYDANSDGSLDATELDMMFEMMDEEDDHQEEGVAFIKLHVEAEGEYGIALPAGVSLHVLMDGDHEGHDHGHDDHDEEGHDEDEEGHDEDEEGHDEDEDHDDHSDEEALAYDPHSWLDPLAFKEQIEVVVGVMSTAFPDGADAFRANADAYIAELDALDEGFAAAFGNNGTCTSDTVVSNHNAYAYLAERYDLEFVTVHGLDPEGEPSAEDIAEVVERIAEDGLTVLFVEEYTNADAVASLAQQTVSDDLPNGVTVLTLYTMELAPMDDSDDYLSLMNKNLENLKTGLGC